MISERTMAFILPNLTSKLKVLAGPLSQPNLDLNTQPLAYHYFHLLGFIGCLSHVTVTKEGSSLLLLIVLCLLITGCDDQRTFSFSCKKY